MRVAEAAKWICRAGGRGAFPATRRVALTSVRHVSFRCPPTIDRTSLTGQDECAMVNGKEFNGWFPQCAAVHWQTLAR
jgi:hypothetical protein